MRIIFEKKTNSCCSDPLACSNNKFRQVTQTIREGNWSFVTDKQAAPISCQAHQLSVFSNSVGILQVELCHLAEALCQEECQVKLNEFKEAFKSCFRIPSNSSLDDILKKAKNPNQAPETIHLAQASNNSGCPSFMPKIKSIKVFQ